MSLCLCFARAWRRSARNGGGSVCPSFGGKGKRNSRKVQPGYEHAERECTITHSDGKSVAAQQPPRIDLKDALATETPPTIVMGTAVPAYLVKGRIGDVYSFNDNGLSSGKGVGVVTNRLTQKVRICRAIRQRNLDQEHVAQEMEILNCLDHPNIMQLYEVFQDRVHYYMILGYCQGGKLIELFMDDRNAHVRNEFLVATICKQLLTAFSYMHGQHVCHRNFQLPHLLVLETPSQSNPLPKCTFVIDDLSLACRFTPGAKIREDVTQWDNIDIRCMAPELLRADGYSELCDLWSLGVCSYILLANDWPCPGETLEALQNVGQVSFEAAAWNDVSRGAVELIGMLLRPEASRCTAKDALTYTWMSTPASQQSLSQHTLSTDQLRAFNTSNLLKKRALQFMAHRLQDNELRELRKQFVALDVNLDGFVTIGELNQSILKLRSNQEGLQDLGGLLLSLDQNGNNCIDYTEFLAAVMDERHYKQESLCWMAFKYFDTNGDGGITRKELIESFKREDMEVNMGDPDFKSLFNGLTDVLASADQNCDQEIDFKEFMSMMCAEEHGVALIGERRQRGKPSRLKVKRRSKEK